MSINGSADQQARIDAAIRAHLKPSWGVDVEDKLIRDFGPSVLKEVKALYNQAVHQAVDWANETLDEAAARVSRDIAKSNPFLSVESTQKLARCFRFVWLF
jgi:hypothetical protein